MSRAYYNEIDPFAVAWLRSLIVAGHLPPGDVDARSIVEVTPNDIRSYTQCHFFAGVGGWAHALRIAGWPDSRPVWTGSCPCQPFSTAGKRGGATDVRHLWPVWHPLIAQCRPPIVFGEQVASRDGLGWLDAVCADLEGSQYAVGAADLCAASVGAPHARQRLWFVADAEGTRSSQGGRGSVFPLSGSGGGRAPDGLADADDAGLQGGEQRGALREDRHAAYGAVGECSSLPNYWSDCDWLPCTDGKARPVEPGTFPLAHGVPGRVGRLRAYGNAIVPQVAARVVRAYMDWRELEDVLA